MGLVGIMAVACDTPPPVAVATGPIIDGAPSPSSEDAAVFILTHDPARDSAAGQYFVNCTGVLLAPNLVLTARHCVSANSDGFFKCGADGEVASGTGGVAGADFAVGESYVFTGRSLSADFGLHKAAARGERFVHSGEASLCKGDVALIVLDRAIEDAVLADFDATDGVHVDDVVHVVGWGMTASVVHPSTRMQRDVTVEGVGPSDLVTVGGLLGAGDFMTGPGLCTGDSGAPAFDAAGRIVGTFSRGDSGSNERGCTPGNQNFFRATAAFVPLICEGFEAAGATHPACAPEPGPEASEPEAELDVVEPQAELDVVDPQAELDVVELAAELDVVEPATEATVDYGCGAGTSGGALGAWFGALLMLRRRSRRVA